MRKQKIPYIQRRLYKHKTNIYRPPDPALSATGKPTFGLEDDLIAEDLRCMFQLRQSLHAPTGGVIIAEQENMMVTDFLHVPADTDIRAGDKIKQTFGPNVGTWWACRGDAIPQTLLIPRIVIEITRLETPP